MKTPSEELVEVIATKLTEAGLLLHEDLVRYKTKIETGSIKQEDWFLMTEKALQRGDEE